MSARGFFRSRATHFVIAVLACEVVACGALAAWDARHPRFKSSVVFDLYSLPMNDVPTDWMEYVRTAAEEAGAADWHVEEFDMPRRSMTWREFYADITRRFTAGDSRRPPDMYYFVAISSDPLKAVDVANSTVTAASTRANGVFSQYKEMERRRELANLKILLKEAREKGDPRVIKNIEITLDTTWRFGQGCSSRGPMMLWEKATPAIKPIRTFQAPFTQVSILCLAVVGAVAHRRLSPKSPPNPPPSAS